MNVNYHKWLEVRINHNYFPDNIAEGFRLVPFEETALILKNNDLLMRQERNVFSFYCGTADQSNFDMAIELAGIDKLQFQLIQHDPLFNNYTANSNLNNTDILYMKNIVGQDLLHVDQAQLNDDPLNHVLGEVLLDVKAITDENNPNKTLHLTFNSREIFWQYKIIVPESRNMEVLVIGIKGSAGETYSGPEDETIVGGNEAKVFTSNSQLPLRQQIENHPVLELIYNSPQSDGQKEMEIKLPNPSADNLRRFNQGDRQGAFHSSTIVYV